MEDLLLMGRKIARQEEKLERLKVFKKILAEKAEEDEKKEAEGKLKEEN